MNNELFNMVYNAYVKKELNPYGIEPSESTMKHTLCGVINESNIVLTKEQVYAMWSILTPDQINTIKDRFEKCNTFWY